MPTSETSVFVSGQVFEVPAESGRYYRARFKERMHQGFPNEYLIVVVVQCNNAGVPLIRDIESAEPCTGAESVDGAGSVEVTVDAEAAGAGTVETPEVDPEGAGDVVWFVDPQVAGTATVT